MAYQSYGSAPQTTTGQPSGQRPRRPVGTGQQVQYSPPDANGQGHAVPSQQPPTFAQMQQQGQARPAPPSPMDTAVQQHVQSQLSNPNPYGSDAVQRSYNLLSQNIDDQYTQAQRATNEQMAQRGLYDSTKAVGALSDLNIGQRDAKTQLAQQLLDAQAQSEGAYQNAAIQNALGYTGQQLSSQLGQGQLALGQGNLDLARVGQQQNYGLAQQQFGLAQQGQQQQYGLAQQQQQLAQQLGLGNLGLQQQQVQNQASQFGQNFGLQQQVADQQHQYQTYQQILQALGLAGQLGVDGGDASGVTAFLQQILGASAPSQPTNQPPGPPADLQPWWVYEWPGLKKEHY